MPLASNSTNHPAAQTERDEPAGEDEFIPRTEAEKAFKQRDKAKAAFRELAAALNIDPSTIEVTETDDADRPYRVTAPALEKIRAALKTDPEALEQVANANAAARVESRDKFIKNVLVREKIRAIAEAQRANGIDDIIELLGPRLKVEMIEDDEESLAGFQVKVVPLNEDGTPMIDPKSKAPLALEEFVKGFLDKRPHLRGKTVRRGPGAGGFGNSSELSSGSTRLAAFSSLTPQERAQAAARQIFGGRVGVVPPPDDADSVTEGAHAAAAYLFGRGKRATTKIVGLTSRR